MNSHARRFVLALLLTPLWLLSQNLNLVHAAVAPEITLNPTAVTIRVGNTVNVTITSTNPAEAITAVEWQDLGEAIEVVAKSITGTAAVTTFKVRSLLPGPKDIKAKITVNGVEVEKTVQVTTTTSVQEGDFPADNPFVSPLKQEDSKTINLNNLAGVTIPSDGLVVESTEPTLVSATKTSDTSLRITGIKHTESPVAINIRSNGQLIKTYNVTVKEAVDHIEIGSNIDSISIPEKGATLANKGEFPLSKLQVSVKGRDQNDLTATNAPSYETNTAAVTVSTDRTKLEVNRLPTADEERPRLMISAPGAKPLWLPINVQAVASSINVLSQRFVAFVGRRDNVFHISVKDSLNRTMPDVPVTWSIKDDANKSCLKILSQGNTEVTVEGMRPCPVATLVATTPTKSEEVTVAVRDASPTGFAPLQIRIDVLDSQTAKDLFGKKAADEFFISKIRLFNKLKNQNGEYGDSILVYSESLEIRVQLEMKDKNGGEWKPILEGEPGDENKPGEARETFRGLFGEPEPFPPDVTGTPTCKDNAQADFVARYRPYTFDIVANTHDRRDERSLRSRILTVANGLSSLASFVTTVAVPAASNDTRLGLDQFKGLLVPSFEKLFPSMKEVQRQNIISMVMRPLEEIPFGSDISRILFIPKGRLYGMIPQKVFRIGGVSTLGACAEVGIIKKAGSAP